MTRLLLGICLTIGLVWNTFAQGQPVTGTVKDAQGETLAGVNVVVAGTFVGTSTDMNGKFKITPDFSKGDVFLVFSFVGYESQRVQAKAGQDLKVSLKEATIMAEEVIVSASRIEERVMETPVTVEQVGIKQLETQASAELFSSLSRYKGIDVNQSSLLLSSLSTRGFNSAKSERVIQMVDNVDYMSPSLSLYAGNTSGVPDIDIETVDIIHGANSALYGANAFNGVINTITKDPFKYEGLTMSLRGGNRSMIDANLRFAVKITPKLAFKVNGTYFSANDFIGNDQSARSLSLVPTNNTQGSNLGWDAMHRYGDIGLTFTGATGTAMRNAGFPTTTGQAGAPLRTVYMPGFSEADMVGPDYKATIYRVNPSLHYLLSDKIKASYEFRLGYGGGIYQSSNRYLWNRVEGMLHKFEVKSDRWFVRAYRNSDAPGETYDLSFWGTGMVAEQLYQAGANASPVEAAVRGALTAGGIPATYAAMYNGVYAQTFLGARQAGQPVDNALATARNAANNVVPLTANDPRFATLRENVRVNRAGVFDPTFENRSHFWDYSAQYQLPVTFADVIVGGSYRQFTLSSKGTLFSDGDFTPVGESRRDQINNWEMGAYAQAQKSFFADKLKISAAGRLDNFKNFGSRFSPRTSAVFTFGDRRQHNFRANYAQAYRAPAQIDQYIRLDIGQILLLGNVSNGFNALPLTIGTLLAQNPGSTPDRFAYRINALKPERMNTWELGYKGIVTKGVYVDVSYYRSDYTDFIGTFRFLGREDGGVPTLTPDASNAPTNRTRTRAMQVWANADRKVTTQGFQVAVDYYINRNLNISTNYTWARLNGLDSKAPISQSSGLILGFNTPEHKFNFGVSGEIIKNLSYNANLRSISSYNYFMPFDEGLIEGFSTVDAQLTYKVSKLNTSFRLGGTNLTDARAIQVFGAAPIGRIVYVGATFDANIFRK
jgi:outer membrane receptor protein involved in Fe transport